MLQVKNMKTRWIGLPVLAATVVLLGLVPAAQAEVRVGVNYKLNSDSSPFRGRDQVALAVKPGNPQHVVSVHANYLDSTCEASVSLDGGDTWSAPVKLSPPAGSGAAGDENFAKSCSNTVGTSAYVEFGSGNNVYTVTTAQRQAGGFLRDATALFFKSTDGGLTWGTGKVAMPGGLSNSNPSLSQGPSFYRPSIGVDREAGQNGADRIHITATDVREVADGLCPPPAPPAAPTTPCSRPVEAVVSHDGGANFSDPVRLGPSGVFSTADFPSKPVVNSDHSVTVAWRTTGIAGVIQVVRWNPSTQTWGNPIDVTKVVNTGTATTTHVQANPMTGQSTSASYPRMEGGTTAGRIYMVFSQGSGGPNPPDGGYQGSDHFINPDAQVWFTRSNDGGLTWSQPKEISKKTSLPGSLTHQTRHPTISVSESGRINVVWHDRRHWYQGPGERNCTHSHIFCEDIRLGDTYYSYSDNGGTSFSDPLRINDRSHNNEVGYDTRPSGYWWFGPQSVTVGGGKQLIAWMDSREGNWTTDNEDIYLAKVDFNATGAAPQTNINQSTAVSRSVALSQLGYQGGAEGALVGGPRDPENPPNCVTTGTNPACPTGPASRNASSVVIVNEGDAAGALAGSVLARANPGPVLLSPAAGLPADVKAEIARIGPARAFLIGDTSSLSAGVVTDLQALGVLQTVRLSGANDAETAKKIAEDPGMDHRTDAEKTADLKAYDAVVIANPATPDAGAAAGLAAARRLPFLYVGADLPAETTAALDSLDIDKALVVGGTAAVSENVRNQISAAVGSTATRLGGASQYETSKAVVDESIARGMPANVVYFADGSKPIDAALVGGVVARASGLLVLAPAPLYSTAAGQASSFGLTGISRSFLAGPPLPGTSTVPPPRPTYPTPTPTPTPARDTTAPTAKLSGAKRQKVGKRVYVTVQCISEACTANVRATVKVAKVGRTKAKRFKLKAVKVKIAKGAKRKVGLKLSAKVRKAIKRALRARKSASAKFTVDVSDSAGNSRRLTRTVKFKR